MDKIQISAVGAEIPRFLQALLGTILFSVGINLFVVPAGCYHGGILGISQMIQTLLETHTSIDTRGIDLSGIFYFFINLPFFFLAYPMSRRFFMQTFLCVLLKTIFLTLIKSPEEPIVKDTLTACFIGGMITGYGTGMTLRFGGAGGGQDILGVYVTQRRKNFRVHKMERGINLFVYGICAFFIDLSAAVYSILFAVMVSFVSDWTPKIKMTREVFILAKKNPEQISEYMMYQMGRGAAYWETKPADSGEKMYVIFTMAAKFELYQLKKRLKDFDPDAFIVSKAQMEMEGMFRKKE